MRLLVQQPPAGKREMRQASAPPLYTKSFDCLAALTGRWETTKPISFMKKNPVKSLMAWSVLRCQLPVVATKPLASVFH